MQYYKLVASLAGEEVAATRKRDFAERIAISAKSNAFNKLFHDRVFFCVADIIDNTLRRICSVSLTSGITVS